MSLDSRRSLALAAVAVTAVACLTVVAAFAFVPFHVGASEAATDSTVGKTVAGNATSEFDGRMHLHAAGPGSDRVADGVATRLERAGLTVERVETLNGSHDRPVLAVRVQERTVAYNPVTPSATVAWSYAYVASGNGTLASRAVRDESLTVDSGSDRYVVDGDFTMRHRARGVYSAPGYSRLVDDRVAATTTASLRNQTRD